MRYAGVVNRTRGHVLGTRIRIANTWWQRTRGLLGRPRPAAGEGLLLVPSRSIHMYGMCYPLDVVMVSADGIVVGLYPHLRPGRRTRWHHDARHALELPAGVIAESRTRIDDHLEFRIAGEHDAPVS